MIFNERIIEVVSGKPSLSIIKIADEEKAKQFIKNSDLRNPSIETLTEFNTILTTLENDENIAIRNAAKNMQVALISQTGIELARDILYRAIICPSKDSMMNNTRNWNCIFSHDDNINKSLERYGIHRITPETKGVTLFKNICSCCSSIISSTFSDENDYLIYKNKFCIASISSLAPLNQNESLIPTLRINDIFNPEKSTNYVKMLFRVFAKIIDTYSSCSSSLPLASIFVFEVIAYFLFLQNNSSVQNIENIAENVGIHNYIVLNIMRNLLDRLSGKQGINNEYLYPNIIVKNNVETVRLAPNIDLDGNILFNIYQCDRLILQDKRQEIY